MPTLTAVPTATATLMPTPTPTRIPDFELISLYVDESALPLTAEVDFRIGNHCQLPETIDQSLIGRRIDIEIAPNCVGNPSEMFRFRQAIDLTLEGFEPGLYVVGVLGGDFSQSVLIDDRVLSASGVDRPQTAELGKISGRVWHDLCINDPDYPDASADGCKTDAAGNRQGNGRLSPNESGISKIIVSLWEGACGTGFLARETETDESGAYRFDQLRAGTYCVAVDLEHPQNKVILEPGAWSDRSAEEPAETMILNLPAGAIAANIHFGWDYARLPRPDLSEVCDDKGLILENIPISSGTRIPSGSTVEKRWILQNIGTCTWESDYQLVPISSSGALDLDRAVQLGRTVLTGNEIELTVELVAPAYNGRWRESWVLVNLREEIIKIGILGNQTLELNETVGTSSTSSENEGSPPTKVP